MTKKKEKIIIKFLKQNNICINLPKGARKLAYSFYESNAACNKAFATKKLFYADVCAFLTRRKVMLCISVFGIGFVLAKLHSTEIEKFKTRSGIK